MKDTNEIAEKLNETVSEAIEKAKKEMIEEMDKKRCELEEIEDRQRFLLKEDCESKVEIQEAHVELIKALGDFSGGGSCKIGVKMIGELDKTPFLKACKQRFSGKEAEKKSAMLFSKWEENLKDPDWQQPFEFVFTEEVVDEEDEKLRNLRKEWGEEVMNAVKTAHKELIEFNTSGRYSIPVLWNHVRGRQATIKEGIAHLTDQIKTLKRKRT